MDKLEFYATDLAEIASQIAEFMAANPANGYVVTCKAKKPTRTLQMVRYYFGVVVHHVCEFHNATEGTWWTKDNAHRYLKARYMVDVGEIGEIIGYAMSWLIDVVDAVYLILPILDSATSKDKDIKQFQEIMERIRKDYDKKGCIIPLPNEVPITAYEPPC